MKNKAVSFEKIDAAVSALKKGQMIIVTDDEKRENEADLICPAQAVTPEKINMMIRHCSGIICLILTEERLKKLHLPLMVSPQENNSANHTAFTLSIEAKHGVTTGVSAQDRARTIQTAIDDKTTWNDLAKPGHIFPLQAKNGGVLERPGHTEGSIDIVTLAGFKPAAVLCELMNPDGTMMKGRQLTLFARKNNLVMLSIQDIIDYRLYHESLILKTASSTLPLDNLDNQLNIFDIQVVLEKYSDKQHVVLSHNIKNNKNKNILVRVHSSCFTGDVLGSLRCDCHAQLRYSLDRISKEGGILIYLNQEGRNIGLFNKINAYALQDKGLDTVEANQSLNLPIDARNYAIAAHILKQKKIKKINLLTNNPQKINGLERYGISAERVFMPAFSNLHNQKYLHSKKTKLKHF